MREGASHPGERRGGDARGVCGPLDLRRRRDPDREQARRARDRNGGVERDRDGGADRGHLPSADAGEHERVAHVNLGRERGADAGQHRRRRAPSVHRAAQRAPDHAAQHHAGRTRQRDRRVHAHGAADHAGHAAEADAWDREGVARRELIEEGRANTGQCGVRVARRVGGAAQGGAERGRRGEASGLTAPSHPPRE